MDLARQLTHEYATKAANTSRMHPDPSIKIKELMEWLSRFMVNRGSRDLFRLPDCSDKLKECDIDGLDAVKTVFFRGRKCGGIAGTSQCRSLFNKIGTRLAKANSEQSFGVRTSTRTT